MEFLFNLVVRKINNYTKQTICDEMNTSKETEAYWIFVDTQRYTLFYSFDLFCVRYR